ncbi:MAG: site-specific integrase, partial [Acidobacteria bacterium]|nr:site-specific integrase [Acidobacteriota bacterium]
SRETTNRHLTEDEYERLVDNSPRWLARVIRWACATGLDRGVIIGLRWADLELKRVNGRIISGTIRMVRPKTGKLIKQTLNERALEALRQASGVRHKDGIIFLSQNGQRIDDRYINRTLDAALERYGISGVSFRSFRHTFATRCVKKGIHATIIGEMIGDSSASVLERYMHTDEEMHDEAARLLSEC